MGGARACGPITPMMLGGGRSGGWVSSCGGDFGGRCRGAGGVVVGVCGRSCGVDRLRGGDGGHRGPILPMAGRSRLRWNSDSHSVAPYIRVRDGLAAVAVSWRVPISSSTGSLSNSNSDRCRAL